MRNRTCDFLQTDLRFRRIAPAILQNGRCDSVHSLQSFSSGAYIIFAKKVLS